MNWLLSDHSEVSTLINKQSFCHICHNLSATIGALNNLCYLANVFCPRLKRIPRFIKNLLKLIFAPLLDKLFYVTATIPNLSENSR